MAVTSALLACQRITVYTPPDGGACPFPVAAVGDDFSEASFTNSVLRPLNTPGGSLSVDAGRFLIFPPDHERGYQGAISSSFELQDRAVFVELVSPPSATGLTEAVVGCFFEVGEMAGTEGRYLLAEVTPPDLVVSEFLGQSNGSYLERARVPYLPGASRFLRISIDGEQVAVDVAPDPRGAWTPVHAQPVMPWMLDDAGVNASLWAYADRDAGVAVEPAIFDNLDRCP